ncbi:MAG TPA: RsmE family RNA methyltransferase [bacterium]|nr:RsmE family RNA methyltransferase [bacterium]HQL61491.1 RsmE family RNA methyltransferase [bacterium]
MAESVRTRLFLPQAGANHLFTNDPEILEVARVLRLRSGDRVGVFADDPLDYWYVVEKSDRNGLELRMTGKEINPANPVVPCILFQAHGTAGKAGNIVREAAALGATEVIFFQAERSIGRGSENKIEKLQKVALESCRQCGRSRVPKISLAESDFSTVLDPVRREYPEILFLTLSPKAEGHLLDSLRSWSRAGVGLIIGPEGGFSPDEESLLRSMSTPFVHLGPRVLRMELAAVVALALVQAIISTEHGKKDAER